MSTTDFNLWASSDVNVSASSFSFHSILDALPRKSKRVAISLEACCTALETSWRSTRETTSKEYSCATRGHSSPNPRRALFPLDAAIACAPIERGDREEAI